MSFSIYISQPGQPDDMIPIAGLTELETVWIPIIREHQLVYLNHAISSGLSITEENKTEVLSELSLLMAALDDPITQACQSGTQTTVAKIRRLIHRIRSSSNSENLYMG